MLFTQDCLPMNGMEMTPRDAPQTNSQRQRAYTELKEGIIFGRYKPGAVLNEREICEALGISRTPYREALIKLEGDDLVVIKPKVGVVVSHIDLPSLKEVVEL
jgi:DNA-binding GntR family transcriptional regulator